jgi:hypothetical protein
MYKKSQTNNHTKIDVRTYLCKKELYNKKKRADLQNVAYIFTRWTNK